ncbi:MAG TPA: phenylacetic acid degradation protein PaaN [Dermatophilaceae bacterium]|nr:phenylacetic acid degradation protein PaaN [Dermatophilaceae bacterium]
MSVSEHPLLTRHTPVLSAARQALAARSYYSRYPESPSPRVYGEGAAERGQQAFEALLANDFELDQPADGLVEGSEVSPYGPALRVRYPRLDLDAGLAAARAATPAWRDAGPAVRAAVCVEIVDAINRRSFELANAVMHTSGQAFVMAFQAGGPHAQDRALEAVAAALAEQERVPASVVWEKPGRGEPVRMRKDYRVVPRGVALVVGCNTFPTWNAYPGLFASLACGNPVVVKPHPRAVLPLAITVAAAREVLREAGFDPALVQLAAEPDGGGLALTLARRPEVAIIDYTGGPSFGQRLEAEGAAAGKLVYTEKSGVNAVVVDSFPDEPAALANLAFSLVLYSGQMCTAPQNIYLPRSQVDAVSASLAAAIGRLTADDARAVELLGALVNDDVRRRAVDLPVLAQRLGGRVVLDTREVRHAAYPDAVIRTPGLVALDVADAAAYSQECFGPVAFLIGTDSTEQSLARMRDSIREHGGMTAAVYSTSAEVLEAAREAAAEAGVALSENLQDGIYVNQTAAFSDYHGTGANPAANAAYTDAAFVASRFRVVTARRHLP